MNSIKKEHLEELYNEVKEDKALTIARHALSKTDIYIKGNEWSAHPKKDGSKLSIKEMMNSTKKWTEYIQALLSDYDNYLSELH